MLDVNQKQAPKDSVANVDSKKEARIDCISRKIFIKNYGPTYFITQLEVFDRDIAQLIGIYTASSPTFHDDRFHIIIPRDKQRQINELFTNYYIKFDHQFTAKQNELRGRQNGIQGTMRTHPIKTFFSQSWYYLVSYIMPSYKLYVSGSINKELQLMSKFDANKFDSNNPPPTDFVLYDVAAQAFNAALNDILTPRQDSVQHPTDESHASAINPPMTSEELIMMLKINAFATEKHLDCRSCIGVRINNGEIAIYVDAKNRRNTKDLVNKILCAMPMEGITLAIVAPCHVGCFVSNSCQMVRTKGIESNAALLKWINSLPAPASGPGLGLCATQATNT